MTHDTDTNGKEAPAAYNADTNETELFARHPEALKALLKDHTTGRNIFWATDSYSHLGEGYAYGDEITPERITGANGMVIRPRALKTKGEQTERTRGMAEVFTPPWVCNAQNNLIDEAWFGRADVFNATSPDRREWSPTPGKIRFPRGKTWKAYVRAVRMEVACGEAPYLASRYDATTGEPIETRRRVGLLDRKLRVVGENTGTSGEWLEMAQEACKSLYAYEWQGDNLLLAREALLVSFAEYYREKFGRPPLEKSLLYAAYIISWNVWQMDGLKGVVPGSCRDGEEVAGNDLFGQTTRVEHCAGCALGGLRRHNGVYCLIRDWGAKDPARRKIRFIDLVRKDGR